MADAFDPYHKWLGISPKDQPPHHYRLLGIDLFEDDLDVIESAADQRMTHVRAFQTGKRSQLSQNILNEIAGARVCLLSPEKKAAYDGQLQGDLPPSAPPRIRPPEMAPVSEPNGAFVWAGAAGDAEPGLSGLRTHSAPRFSRRKDRTVWMLWGAAGLMIVLAVVLVLVALQRKPEPVTPPPVVPSPSDTSRGSPSDDQPSDDQLSDDQLPGGEAMTEDGSTGPAVADGSPAAGAEGVGDTTEVDNGAPPTAVPERPDVVQKVPVPGEIDRKQAGRRLGQELAEASPAELLAAALAEGRDASERYVLLLRVREEAVASADVALALETVDALATRFEIDPLTVKAEMLENLAGTAGSPAQFRTIAETALKLADEAETTDRHDLVEKLLVRALGSARDAEDSKLVNTVTLRFLDRRQAE